MKIIIVEDEKPAAQKLQKAILRWNSSIEILSLPGSVEATVAWLNQHGQPDLLFMDIQLTDGLSFQIFEQATVRCPVIFTTAYDDYWQEAFEHNSIDYLLKPIRQEKLEAALRKYDTFRQFFAGNLQGLQHWHQQTQAEFRKRFLVKRGADYISVRTSDIAYFYAAHKLVCLVDNKNQKFILDQSLSDIEKQLDPGNFYRVNRKYLVNMTAIRRMKVYPKSKLQLEVHPPVKEEIVIAQENVAGFKEWMGQ